MLFSLGNYYFSGPARYNILSGQIRARLASQTISFVKTDYYIPGNNTCATHKLCFHGDIHDQSFGTDFNSQA
jgi:hypothetical protein